MPKRRTHESFVKEIAELVGDEYTVLTEFKGVDIKVLFRHNTNGNEFWMTPYHFINRGQRDPDPEEIRKRNSGENSVHSISKDEVMSRIHNKHGDRFELVGTFEGLSKHTKFYDTLTNKYVDKSPQAIICLKKKSVRHNSKSPEEFEEEVFEKVGDKYIVITPYVNSHTKVRMRNNETGFEWDVLPHSFLAGHREPLIYRGADNPTVYTDTDGTVRNINVPPIAEVKKRLEQVTKGMYTLVDETYKRMSEKATFINVSTKEEWHTTPSNIIVSGHKAPKRSKYHHKGINTSKTTLSSRTEKFKQQLSRLASGRYVLIGEYIGAKTLTKFLDTKTGETFIKNPNNMLRNPKNPSDNKVKHKTAEEFNAEIKELTKGEYKTITPYKNAYTPIDFLHVTNNNIFSMTPHNFLRGQRDPNETQPKGEKELQDLFDELGVNYVYQYRLPDEKNRTKALRPDFYLPDYNAFIEFDGPQHFMPVEMFGGEKMLASQQQRDALKNAYAYEHNIRMVRIPYCYLGRIKQFLMPFINSSN